MQVFLAVHKKYNLRSKKVYGLFSNLQGLSIDLFEICAIIDTI